MIMLVAAVVLALLCSIGASAAIFPSARQTHQYYPQRTHQLAGGDVQTISSLLRHNHHYHRPRTHQITTRALFIRGGDIQTISSLHQIEAIIDEASRENNLVVLDFASNNCPPCEMIAPIYHDLSDLEEFANVVFCKVNVSEHPEIASRYGVDGWPTFLLFKGGEAVDSIVGGQAAKAGLYGMVAKYHSQ